MAIAKMLRPDFQQRRVNRLAYLHDKRAPRMKAAPRRKVKSPRDFTRADYLLRLDLLLSVADHWNRGEKHLRVRMNRVPEELLGGCDLPHLPEVHYHHPVCDVPHEAEVVSDEHVRKVQPVFQSREHAYDLRLNRNVQRRSRLIEHDERRIRGERPSNRNELLLPASELLRISVC